MIEHYTMTGRWHAGSEGLSDLAFRRHKLRSAELRLLGGAPPKQMPHTMEVRLPVEFEWDDEEKVQLVSCEPLLSSTAGKTMAEAQDEIQSMIAAVLGWYVEEGSLFAALHEIGWSAEQNLAACALSADAPPPVVAEAIEQPQAWTINEARGGWKVGRAAS
ncbi:MAG: hypothetical protein OXU94_03730 [Gammaproteobacteria bacterium]|nr:hypothetical protein [Gammaproteobacteria bacterium]